MKEEWKPDALRETAEEIRSAVMPKSITPEMVGGTLLALTNAVGEVVETLGEIPTGHVKVTVVASDGTNLVDSSSARVYVDVFAVGGIPTISYPRRELTVDENGCVEFDVPIGCKYSVFSKIDGLGASMQFVYEAAYETREVLLHNLPVGVWWIYAAWVIREDDEDYGEYRIWTFDTYVTDWESELFAAKLAPGESLDDSCHCGIVVSTADTCFIIPEDNLSAEKMAWCKPKDYKNEFITLPDIWYNFDGEEWSEVQNRAREDWDGNLNSAKILAHATDAPAAEWCANIDPWNQVFLPSSGQLYLMYLNRDAINKIMKEANADGWSYKLLPYQLNGRWQYPNGSYEYWWSSSRSTLGCSWVVYYNGIICYYGRYGTYDVRAVSAFHFEY